MARIKFSALATQTMKPEFVARSRKAANREIAAMELSELRDTFKVTQLDLAGRMKVPQAAISKLEKPNRNIHVDQLRSIVSAMGGNLRIPADFDDRKIELIGKVEDSQIEKGVSTRRPRRPNAAAHHGPNPADAEEFYRGRCVRLLFSFW